MMRWVAIGAVLGFLVAYSLLSSGGAPPPAAFVAPTPAPAPIPLPGIEQMKHLQPLPGGLPARDAR